MTEKILFISSGPAQTAFLANEKLQGLCVAVFVIYSSPQQSLCPYLNLLLNISFCKFKESPLFFQKGFRFVSQQYTRCINIRKNTVRVSCIAPKSSDLSLKLSWTFLCSCCHLWWFCLSPALQGSVFEWFPNM